MLSGLVRKLHGGESDVYSEAYSPLNMEEETPEDGSKDGKLLQSGIIDAGVLKEGNNGQGPDIVKYKKKVNAKGSPTNFFIDKVLRRGRKRDLFHKLLYAISSSLANCLALGGTLVVGLSFFLMKDFLQ
jgi:hypothetical protein